MPYENHWQHQQSPTTPAIEPVLKMLNADDVAETDFSKLHTALKIGRFILAHGTFMGDDPFGVAETLKSVAESVPLLAGQLHRLAEASLEKTRPLTTALTGDVGNYHEPCRERFQELAGDDPLVELFSPTWSGQNHHLARADLAVRLLHQLLLKPLLPGHKILLWGHSLTGNAFAVLTNLPANHKLGVQQFFAAAAQDGVPHRDDVRNNLRLAASPHPLAKRINMASFETPVRYGWDIVVEDMEHLLLSRIAGNIGPHFKWFIVNGVVLSGGTNGDLMQDFFGQLRQADVGQGDRQANLGCEPQHSMQHRTRLSFQHKLRQQPKGDFFTMQVIMRGPGRGQPVVNGMGRCKAGGLEPNARQQRVRFDKSFQCRSHDLRLH